MENLERQRIFIEKSRKIHGDKYDYSKVNYKNLIQKVIIILNNNEYLQSPSKHLLGRCPEKNTLRKTTEQFIQEASFKWGNKYDYSLVDYKGALKKVKIIYNDIVYEQTAIAHIKGISPEFRIVNTKEFIKRAKIIWGNKYDYSLVNYKSSKRKVKIIYNGIVYEQVPSGHLSGSAPEKIILSVRKTTEQFIKESNEIHDNKYEYRKTNYIKNQIKVTITCKEHGDFEQSPLSHIQGCGCPNCNESKGEREIVRFLDKNKISYQRQKKFIDCRNIFELPFDFWIPSKRTLIEFDGKQHFEPILHFGGQQTYEALKINDKIKNNYCEDTFINLIRIPYYDINIINEILSNNFLN